MSILGKFEAVAVEDAKQQLGVFLTKFNNPAFGAMPKREIELAVFELFRDLKLIDEKAPIYDLMTELRVTRPKASQLLFDLEVRKHGGNKGFLDNEIQSALIQTKFAKDGDYFVLEIENPLTIAHLRQRIRDLGHISDTSFNSAIVRMPLDAVTDLMLDLIPKDDHDGIRQAMIAAGAPDKSFKAILKGALKKLGSKVIGEAADQVAEAVVDNASDFISPILNSTTDAVTDKWQQIFGQQNEE